MDSAPSVTPRDPREGLEFVAVSTLVAVARKLAVLLHQLWVTRDVYEPLHHTETETRTAPAAA